MPALVHAVRHSGAAITPVYWRVFFLPKSRMTWWDWFSPSEYRHCLAMAYCVASNSWLIVDPSDQRTVTTVIPSGPTFDEFHADVFTAATCAFEVEAIDGKPLAQRWGQWCSTQLARLLGVSGSAWRPYALAKTLRAQNAKVLKDERQSEGSEGRS